MALTKTQRSKINKQNASHSTGPRSAEGKAVARANAVKHGLCARVVALANEDPVKIKAREDVWNDYYDPRSPAAQHLVNECVRATILSDRVDAALTERIDRQVREANPAWWQGQHEGLDALVRLMKVDPDAALTRLRATAHGCRHLVESWERLDAMLEKHAWWSYDDRNEAIRLLGHDPTKLKESPVAWHVALLHAVRIETKSDHHVRHLFQPDVQPGCMKVVYTYDRCPDPDGVIQTLREMIEGSLQELRSRVAHLEEEVEKPDESGAEKRAMVPEDSPSARLLLRYRVEARTSFHRSFTELVKTLARDAAERGGETGSGGESAASPPAAPAPPEAAPRNEPNFDAIPGEKKRSIKIHSAAACAEEGGSVLSEIIREVDVDLTTSAGVARVLSLVPRAPAR